MSRKTLYWGVLLTFLVTPGCDDESAALQCEDGYVEQDGECVPDRSRRRTGADTGAVDASSEPTTDTTGDDTGPTACRELSTRCSPEGVPQTCVEGVWADGDPCLDNEMCSAGHCITEDTCNPGDVFGCASETSQRVCDTDGIGFVDRECPDSDPFCFRGICGHQICEPERTRCGVEPQDVEICDEDGESWVPTDPCSEENEEVCFEGECVTGCLASLKEPTYIGCAYWSVDLPQYEDPFGDPRVIPHIVVVANPGTRLATVTVETQSGATLPQPSVDVPFGEVRTIQFPRLDVEGTTRSNRTFRLTSTEPIIAYQFNPLNNEGVASNDASLLLPESALGTEHYVMSWGSGVAFMGFAPQTGWFSVVAASPGTTTVDIEFTADVHNGISADLVNITNGSSHSFEMQQWEVLNFEAKTQLMPPVMGDLTGTHVVANQRVAVFGGHEEAVIEEPGGDACCADHLEEQLFPVAAWGMHHLAVHSPPRGNEADFWRVIASQPGTRISTSPQISGLHGITLGAGQWVEVMTTVSFEVVGTAPILVTQYIVSQTSPGTTRTTGDPSMVLAVPVEQYRDEYSLLTPDRYNEDYVTVIRPVGSLVQLDTTELPATDFHVFGTGEYEYSWVEWEPGPHNLVGDAPFGVIMFGYDTAVSYGYPGGLNLNPDL